jgi:putative ABC transport system permease protein
MLIRNFLKDIRSTLPRLLSVIIITALGVLIFVAMNTVNTNLLDMANTFFRQQNAADFWIYGDNLNKTDEKKIRDIPGVGEVQSQLVVEAEPLREQEVTVILHGVSGGYKLNTPLIIKGDFPKSKREIMLLENYAKSHNLDVGDQYELLIKNTNKKMSFTVCALIKTPEYMSIATNTEPVQNSYKTGVAFMDENTLSEIAGSNTYNQMCVKLNDDASENYFKNEVKARLGYKVSNMTALPDKTSSYIVFDTIHYITVIATILPWIFFIISALIMFTTMSRIIENARLQIGTLKALGYKDSAILLYYLSYCVIVVIIGMVLGCLPSMRLAVPLYHVFNAVVILPPHEIVIDRLAIVYAFLLTSFFCVGTAFIICEKELRENPAECMRPKPPKAAKDILFERITFWWNRLNFSAKTVARNIFRNKMRMFMCIAGVTGCMGIILAALGFWDSNNRFIDQRYENLYQFDLQVTMKRNTPEIVYRRLKALENVQEIEYEMDTTISVYKNNRKESGSIHVMEDSVSLMLISDMAQVPAELPRDGILLARNIAEKLDIGIGAEITYTVGGSSRKVQGFVSGFSESNLVSYAGKSYWESKSHPYAPAIAYIRTNNPDAVSDKVMEYDFVVVAKNRDELIRSIRTNFKVIDVFVAVFITFGGMLALVVLYNLGILNFYERMRELATLMVLGFRDKEIKTLILTENIIFTMVGILFGLPFGIALAGVLIGDSVRFGYTLDMYIKPGSYVIAIILTMSFSQIVNLMLGKNFKKIDMIGALKSVE